MFICREKLNFIPDAFMEIMQRYANLFWVLWACLVTLTQNDSIIFLKTAMFICMQKNKLHNSILTILHFKESRNFIGLLLATTIMPDMFWWNSNNNISFHYRLFPRKTNMTKLLKKSPKPYFGPILVPFAQMWVKNEFSWKKGSVSFSIFELPTIVPKIRKT